MLHVCLITSQLCMRKINEIRKASFINTDFAAYQNMNHFASKLRINSKHKKCRWHIFWKSHWKIAHCRALYTRKSEVSVYTFLYKCRKINFWFLCANRTYEEEWHIILPLWQIFVNENEGWDFTISPSVGNVSPAPLPWFVYSNLLQNVSRPFINPTHLTWHGYFMHVVRADIRASHMSKLPLKFCVPISRLSWAETVHKTPVLKTLSYTN